MTELAVIEQSAVAIAYQTQGGVKSLLEKLAKEVSKEVPDTTTAKGRARIASLAHKVSKSKVVVDDHGKELVAAEKARLALIDADRKLWRDGCDALRDKIRQPLTDWEQAEESRVQALKDRLQALLDMAKTEGMTAADIEARLQAADAVTLGDSWQEFAANAGTAKDDVLRTIRAALTARQNYEAEQAELARLRTEAAQREQEERDRRIAQEAADKARADAEAKAAKEKAETEAKARAEREQAEQARIAAEQAEARAKAEAEAAKLREAEAERRRIEEQERARLQAIAAAERAERDKQAAIEAERQRAEHQRKTEQEAADREKAEREANKKHRQNIHAQIKTAMLAAGLDDAQAVALIKAIAAGSVPHVSIEY